MPASGHTAIEAAPLARELCRDQGSTVLIGSQTHDIARARPVHRSIGRKPWHIHEAPPFEEFIHDATGFSTQLGVQNKSVVQDVVFQYNGGNGKHSRLVVHLCLHVSPGGHGHSFTQPFWKTGHMDQT